MTDKLNSPTWRKAASSLLRGCTAVTVGALAAIALAMSAMTAVAAIVSALGEGRVELGRAIESGAALFYLFQLDTLTFFQKTAGSESASVAPLVGLLVVGLAISAGGFVAAKLMRGSQRQRVLAGAYLGLPLAAIAYLTSLILRLRYSAGLGFPIVVTPSAPGSAVLPALWGSIFGLLGATRAVYGRQWRRRVMAALHDFLGVWWGPARSAVTGIGGGLIVLAGALLVGAGAFAAIHPQLLSDLFANLRTSLGTLVAIVVVVPNLVGAAFLGSMGIPLNWDVTALVGNSGTAGVFGGTLPTGDGVSAVPALAVLALLIPALVTLRIGYLAARKSGEDAGGCLLAGLRSALPFTLACWALALLVQTELRVGGLLGFHVNVSTLAALLLPACWGVIGGGLGALTYALRSGLATPKQALRLLGSRLSAPKPVLGSVRRRPAGATARPGGSRPARSLLVAVGLLLLLGLATAGAGGAPKPPSQQPQALDLDALKRLQVDADGKAEVTVNPLAGVPSFIRGRVPIKVAGLEANNSSERKATALVNRYANLLRIDGAASTLRHLRNHVDNLGMTHVYFDQGYRGVKVETGSISVHFDATGKQMVAVSNALVPGIDLAKVEPSVERDRAIATARAALPKGKLVESPQLVVYPGHGPQRSGANAVLAWLVWLAKPGKPVSNTYVVDAQDGAIVDVFSHIEELGKNRLTYSADGQCVSPPDPLARLVRTEAELLPPTDPEIDGAHNFAGLTYDYYWNTPWRAPDPNEQPQGRDSYDGFGGTMISTAHYCGSPENPYKNSFWTGDPESGVVYGDGMVANDVVAHEWTHAVNQYSADLFNSWQSGALNESFADMFGTMVDRDDWLIGEDTTTLGAYGDLSDPPRFGQPDHTSDWVVTCEDSYGVHTNSGITNKAFYNVATATSKESAELIFYRALTLDEQIDPKFDPNDPGARSYLNEFSSLEDARAAAIQSAVDIFGDGSPEESAVVDAFNAVGLDGIWQPPGPPEALCNPDPPAIALSGGGLSKEGPSALKVLATLYRARDELAQESPAGDRYMPLYEPQMARIGELLDQDPWLKLASARLLQRGTPAMTRLMDGHGDRVVVSRDLVRDVKATFARLVRNDRASGGGALASLIERELRAVNLNHFVGMSFAEAWTDLNDRIAKRAAAGGTP